MDGGIGVFTNWRENSWEALEFQGETGLLLTCDGNVGIPVLTKQGNHHLERRRGTTGLFLSCVVKHSVPLQWGLVSQGSF